MNALVIVDGSGATPARAVHGMDLALELARSEGLTVRVYLLGTAVEFACAGGSDATAPDVGRTVSRLVSGGVEVAVSETELSARWLLPDDLVVGAQPASAMTLAAWTLDAERILVF